jgi:hypothetical protein
MIQDLIFICSHFDETVNKMFLKFSHTAWTQCCKTFFVRNLRIFVISKSVYPGKPF